MKVCYTGTRKGMTQQQREALLLLLKQYQVEEIRHGCCVGGDEELHRMLLTNPDITSRVFIHPPMDTRYMSTYPVMNVHPKVVVTWMPRKPFLVRNHDMVDATGMTVGTPRGGIEVLRSGTWATVRYARQLSKIVHIIYPDGKVI